MWQLVVLGFFSFGLSSFADTANPSEFKVDRGVLDRIYNESVSDAKVPPDSATQTIELRPRFSFLSLSQLTLKNKYFEVPYASNGGLSNFSLGVSVPMQSWGHLNLAAEGRVGYSQRESLTAVTTAGSLPSQDVIRLHLVPLSASLRFDYGLTPWLMPSLSVGAGAAWVYQSGKLDGIEQGFWIPFVQASPAITFWGSQEHWFGGLSVGISYLTRIASDQSFRALSYDLGASFRL